MYKFSGNVNGVKYDTLEEYNKAITEAMGKQQPITASYQTEMVADETESSSNKQIDNQDIHNETSKLQDFNKKLYRFDLDQLDGTQGDYKLIDNFKGLMMPEKAKELAKEAKEALSETEQEIFVDNIRKHIKNIDTDIKFNKEALQAANNDVTNRIALVGQLQKKLAAAKETLEKSRVQVNVLKHADEILQAESDFYNATIKKVPESSDASKTSNPIETTCQESKPQQETSIWDSPFPQYNKEHVKNLLKEIFDFD